MPNYKKRNLVGAETSSPPLEPLRGGQLAKRDRVLSMFRQADSVLGNGRRVIGRVGLHGSERFQVVSTTPETAGQTYPLLTATRKAARMPPIKLTPGHMLRFSALVCPSGMTQKVGGMGYTADVAYGRIQVRVTFTGGATDTTVFTTNPLPVSGEQYAGEKTAAGAAWAALTRVDIPIIYPESVTQALADLREWSDGITAEVTIEYIGGVRCVDAVVQEVPYAYARDVGTDTDYAAVLATDLAGAPIPTYPSEYPIEELSATDPTCGSILLADVVHRHQREMGPILAQWTGWDEETQSVSATEATGGTTSSTSFVNITNTSLTSWSASNPGWSLASGGSAQSFATSNHLRELRGADAVVPVRLWVYGSRSVTGTATVRFQSATYSIGEVSIASASEGWYSAIGHLRCGLGLEDPTSLQVLGRVSSGSSTLTVRAIMVEFYNA